MAFRFLSAAAPSLRARLILLAVVSITLAQSIGLALSVWNELSRYASGRRDSLLATAQIIAASAARATAENDLNGAYQSIRSVGRIDKLVYAGIETPDGRTLAEVGATEQLASDLVIADSAQPISNLAIVSVRTVETQVDIVYGGERVGRLRVIGDTRDLPERIWSAVSVSGLGALLALLVALLVAVRLQRSIIRPLTSLTRTMARVRERHDYSISLRGERAASEIGVLIDGFNAMIGDVRERDQRLVRHQEHLEQEVTDRTRDYQRAAAEADAANQAKSDFLATMSHEIRTPMNGILVMAELLASNDMPRRARRQAQVIARSGESLLAIINDILDFSKIEAGKLDVEWMDVGAADAVEDVVRLFADRARTKGLDLAAQIDLPPGALVTADSVRLGQVLGNLVNNALKFTERGGVIVRAAFSAGPGGPITFTVSDTGIGIAEDKLATVFQAFSQADASTTRRFGGTGLGLAIARRLVEAMGGDLGVTSEPGVGTQFFFTLRAAAFEQGAEWPRLEQGADAPVPTALVDLDGAQSTGVARACLAEAGMALADRHTLSLDGVALTLALVSSARLRGTKQAGRMHAAAIAVIADPHDDAQDLISAGLADAVLPWPLLRTDLAEVLACLRDGRPLASLHQEASGTARVEHRFDGLRVLVADDSEVNREVAQVALQQLGIQPDLVSDGHEAIAAVASGAYDLVLMDGSMPDLDGFEATRRIREAEAAEGRDRLPIVALTAHVVGAAANAWRECGMDGVLHKPFTLAKLAAIIETHARREALSRQAGQAAAEADAADAPAAGGALDLSVLDQLREMAGGDPAMVRRIVDLYCDQSQARLQDLAGAVADRNVEQLGALAHALKSMSYNVGARAVADRAGAFEHRARVEGSLVEEADLDALRRDVEAATGELRAYAA